MKLLAIPIGAYNNVLTVLELKHFNPLLELLDTQGRKATGTSVIENCLTAGTYIGNEAQVFDLFSIDLIPKNLTFWSFPRSPWQIQCNYSESFCPQVSSILTMIAPLIYDQDEKDKVEMDAEDFAEEQGLLGRWC